MKIGDVYQMEISVSDVENRSPIKIKILTKIGQEAFRIPCEHTVSTERGVNDLN